jgi:hypothetical protein
MRYSRNSIRWAIKLALILIGLLNTPGGSIRARRQPGSPVTPHAALLMNSEASAARIPPPASDGQTGARAGESLGVLGFTAFAFLIFLCISIKESLFSNVYRFQGLIKLSNLPRRKL